MSVLIMMVVLEIVLAVDVVEAAGAGAVQGGASFRSGGVMKESINHQERRGRCSGSAFRALVHEIYLLSMRGMPCVGIHACMCTPCFPASWLLISLGSTITHHIALVLTYLYIYWMLTLLLFYFPPLFHLH
jgi:hypothetical protein